MTEAEFIWQTTLDYQGGTFALAGQDVPTTGYMVSLAGYEQRLYIGDFTPGEVEAYITKHAHLLTVRSDLFFGTWTTDDEDAGEPTTVVLDISQRLFTRPLAERIGRQRKQDAIWDLTNDQEIML